MEKENANYEPVKLSICSGCIREDNKPLNIGYLPKFATMEEAIESAQKCPSCECIYDTPKRKGIEISRAVLDSLSQLVDEIEHLNNKYRTGDPEVSDQYYDSLLEQLAILQPGHPLLKKGVIEQSKEGTRKRKLRVPMMSLNKEKSVRDIHRWLQSKGIKDDDIIIITPKLNGVSLLDDRTQKMTCTRGDGIYGQECNEHFVLMNNLISVNNLVGASSFNDATSGEAIISRNNWNKYFKGQLAPSGSPYRLNNATVAGLLNADEPDRMLQYVDFVPYSIHSGEHQGADKLIQLLALANAGGPISWMCIRASELTEDVVDLFFQEENKIYPIDGVVIDINDKKLRAECGFESNGNPAYARALKLGKWVEEFDTKITGYDFTISKQGKLKGVVTFDPVFINGTEVKQATYYNAGFLFNWGLCPGMKITVKKSGEIIPKIVAIEGVRIPIRSDYETQHDYEDAYLKATDHVSWILGEKKLCLDSNLLEYCPECDEPLAWDSTFTERFCSNKECDGIKISKISHFFTTIGVEEFGRQTIKSLYKAGYDSVKKILTLSREELSKIEGFGESSADIIINEFDRVKKEGVPFARLLYAWDLFEGKIGEKIVQAILDGLDGKDFDNITKEKLVKIEGVSEITANVFLRGWSAVNDELLLIPTSYITTPTIAHLNTDFAGFSVCFSGVRDAELEKTIVSRGGKIASGVSKSTTHLVVADKNQSTQKTEKARALGVVIMTLDEFKAL